MRAAEKTKTPAILAQLSAALPAFMDKFAQAAVNQQEQLKVWKEKAVSLLEQISVLPHVIHNKILGTLKQCFYLYEGENAELLGKFFTFDCTEPENIIVINKEGKVVFDSGAHNGALYLLLNNVDISQKTAVDIIKDNKNFKQLTKIRTIGLRDGSQVCVGEWVGSKKDLADYARGQANQVGFSEHIETKVRKIKYNPQKGAPQNGMTLKWGDNKGNPLAENDRTLMLNIVDVQKLPSKKAEELEALLNSCATNPYELQNMLIHEAKHNEQADRMQKGIKMTRAQMEVEAIETQMQHATWEKTSELFKRAAQNYLEENKKFIK